MTSDMRVERAEPIRNQVARLLRAAIESQRFKPGAILVERELCDLTGASRPSVREALRQLETEGLVVSVPGRGSVVASVSEQEAREIYEVRGVLEGLAGREFALHATDELRDQLKEVVDRFEKSMDAPAELIAIKNDFYGLLFSGGGNGIARQMHSSLQRRISLLRSATLAQPGRPEQTLKELRSILEAIGARDGELAEARCREHVAFAQVESLKQFVPS